MNKDWTGNKASTFVTLGASNHSLKDREINDYYATDPKALEIFLDRLKEDGIELHRVWECACGQGHLSNVLKNRGVYVASTDLVDRGYGEDCIDFLKFESGYLLDLDILTNPPYKYAKEFVEKGLELVNKGHYVIMFLKIQFLEGQARLKLFKQYPPKYVYVNSARQNCYINGDMSKKMSNAVCYCWYVWEKGYMGEPIIRWI